MRPCDDIRGRLSLYLDNELQGEERAQFESHLRDCESCRSLAMAERRFLSTVREAQPMYLASPELQTRIRSVLSVPTDSQKLLIRRFPKRTRVIAALVAAALYSVIAVVIGGYEVPASLHVSNFALMAADTHLRHMRGELPRNESPEPQDVSHWFITKFDSV